ncbi:hypothetical protein ZIOFF_065241 [Zingiber officinale]|uniref:RRM domain-containing protein n=1 Tax=Zingiber officinale TaxID=94328 RepID=A0A8J5EZS9_ZINOF|nr:hypothetical protein ZIOFF_065241 [Zingiber officinale]
MDQRPIFGGGLAIEQFGSRYILVTEPIRSLALLAAAVVCCSRRTLNPVPEIISAALPKANQETNSKELRVVSNVLLTTRYKMSRVYVGNLDSRVSERDLEDEFRTFGVLRSVWVARRPPGYGFVEFDDRRDAMDAIRDIDGGLGSGRRRSPSPPRYRRSPSYGRGSRSPQGRRSPRRRSYSPRSRSPAYRREDSPHANRSPGRDRKRSYSPRPEKNYSRSPAYTREDPPHANGYMIFLTELCI